MSATCDQPATVNPDNITRLAWQLWQQEGGKCGRDQKYWIQDEWKLQPINRPVSAQTNKVRLMRNHSRQQQGKSATSQPVEPTNSSLACSPTLVPIKYLTVGV